MFWKSKNNLKLVIEELKEEKESLVKQIEKGNKALYNLKDEMEKKNKKIESLEKENEELEETLKNTQDSWFKDLERKERLKERVKTEEKGVQIYKEQYEDLKKEKEEEIEKLKQSMACERVGYKIRYYGAIQSKEYWYKEYNTVYNTILKVNEKLRLLREGRRREQENHEKQIKKLKKEKLKLKYDLEKWMDMSEAEGKLLREQLEFFVAEGFKLELDTPLVFGKRKFYGDIHEPWVEEVLEQIDKKLEEKDEEIKKLKVQNKKLNDVVLVIEDETKKSWCNFVYL